MGTSRTGKYRYCRFCSAPFDPPRSRNTCASCTNKVRNVRKRLLLDGFLERGCADCGEADPVVLEVHHKIPREGRMGSIGTNGRTVSQLQRELEDCEVLCANCHRRRHASGQVLNKYGHMVGRDAPRKRGYDSEVAKMTPEMHQAILKDREQGLSLRSIATKHGVGTTTVARWLKK